jgi:hypothetical protein
MDPADFAAHMLPKISYTELYPSNTHYIRITEGYDECCEEFLECVAGDCYAITVDDEILCNFYEPKSVREYLQDNTIRQNIIDCPKALFDTLMKREKNARVMVYMSEITPWFLAIYYNFELGIATFEYYTSQESSPINCQS